MKKILFILILVLFLVPQLVRSEGLVPCGGPGEEPCQLCHLFVMLDRIIDFILFKIIPPLAILMLGIGGVMFFFGGGNPETLRTAKRLITSVAMGIAIVYGAWLIINIFFAIIGVAEWTGLREGWFIIECP